MLVVRGVPALATLLRLILNFAGGSPDEFDEARVESLCALLSVVTRGIGAASGTRGALCPNNS